MAQQQSNNQAIGIAMVTWRNVLLTLELSKTTRDVSYVVQQYGRLLNERQGVWREATRGSIDIF
jgi:hypothetical protein